MKELRRGLRFILVPSLILLFLLAALTCSRAQSSVPGTTSPDGKVVLWFQPAFAPPDQPEANQFLFRDKQTLATRSGNLEPNEPSSMTTPEDMEADDAIILFDHIAAKLIADRGGEKSDPAFTFKVAWSADSRWVSIEGGAHKFWKALIYHRIADRFEPVRLPDGRPFNDYYTAHQNHIVIQRADAKGAINKISNRNYDYPNVCWLENGLLAVNGYPYLLRNSNYGERHDDDLFFLLDTTTDPATIRGFCR